MDAANSTQEAQDRLALLLITRPRVGWEREFEELIRRAFERLATSTHEREERGG